MKKILLIIIIITFDIKLFAEGGFEAILNVPLGASLGIFNGEVESIGSEPQINTKAGFDAGINIQIGYMFAFGKFGLSILGDLGYSYDSFKYSLYHNVSAFAGSEEYNIYNNIYLHSFQIGIIPKLNIGSFSLGLGGGIKIPFAGISENKTIKTINIFGDTIKSEDNIKKDYKSLDYLSYIMGYIKITFDYSFFFTGKLALNLGAYFGYDIGLPYREENSKGNNRVDSFDIGFQIGLRFAPRL
ncbi:hypothetical protein JQ824_08705 [Brachyspira hyodysenteriae]|nr:hypothetical protein [Brachyspira hyodysenteriae]ANN63714.1 hypothetical protein BHYOB78_07490 [Brachyspira hyodysenteriae ATCC 27164]KLI13165.1 hypothetical protein SU45_13755 [Brachyspira hyodysenteriae]KLI19546.1 hypothetical protein SU46_06805 [Brachyspira hyodysenteriae]KLI22536.1 hypothetical protein SR30_10775 [Brachyspira hyodysenteriae]KLI28265.1 hypothetical protein SZ47_02990 [Brachyspira hyodysenteriae]